MRPLLERALALALFLTPLLASAKDRSALYPTHKTDSDLELNVMATVGSFSFFTTDKVTGGVSTFASAQDVGGEIGLKIALLSGEYSSSSRLKFVAEGGTAMIKIDAQDNSQFSNLNPALNQGFAGFEVDLGTRISITLGASYAQFVMLAPVLSGPLPFVTETVLGAEARAELKILERDHSYVSIGGLGRFLRPSGSGVLSSTGHNYLYNFNLNAGTGFGFFNIMGTGYYLQQYLESSTLTQSWSESGLKFGLSLDF